MFSSCKGDRKPALVSYYRDLVGKALNEQGTKAGSKVPALRLNEEFILKFFISVPPLLTLVAAAVEARFDTEVNVFLI